MRPSVLALLPLIAAGTVDAQSTLMWRDTLPREVTGFFVSPLGNLIVATPGAFSALDPTSGGLMWRVSLQSGHEITALGDTPFGVLETEDSIAMLDLTTGERRWDMSVLGSHPLYGYLATRDLLLCLMGESDSASLVAVDLGAGRLRWRHDHPFTAAPKHYRTLVSQRKVFNQLAGEEPPLWVNDTTFILYVSADGPVLVDANTGAFLWQASALQGERPPAARDAYPPMLRDDSLILVPYGKRLQAIRLRDGSAAWAQPAEFPSRIAQLELTPNGVLVRGARREGDAPKDAPFIAFVNPATGTPVWPEMWKRGYSFLAAANHDDPPPNTSPFVPRGSRVYFAWKGDLYALTLGDGEATKLGKLRFKGGEAPELVENRADGILFFSAQNMLLADTTGRSLIQRYFPAPPVGWLAHVAKVAVLVTLDVAQAALAQSQANRTGVPQTYHPVYSDNPFLRARYAAAEIADDYSYVLTIDRDSTGQSRSVLLRVPKDRDTTAGRVWLSEKHPPFRVDPFTASVYVQTGPNEITAFRFPVVTGSP